MLGYRSLFTVAKAGGFEALVDSQFRSWLKAKGYAADELDLTATGRTEVRDQTFVEVIRPDHEHATQRRIRLVEPHGWLTELTTENAPHHNPWVWLEVHAPQDGWTGTPRLVRHLLASLEARDSEATLREHPRLVSVDEIDELITVVCDPDRRGLVFVAGSDTSLPWKPWRAEVENILRETVGVAASYILDPAATAQWADSMTRSHWAPAGSIRTYLPEADPADPVDGRRHRFLGAATIASGDSQRLRRRLARAARAQLLDQPLPPRFTRVDRTLRRHATDLLVARITQPKPLLTAVPEPDSAELVVSTPQTTSDLAVAEHAGPVPVQPDRRLALLVSTLVGTDELTNDSIGELERLALQGRAAQQTVEALRTQMLDMHTQIERLQDANAVLTHQRDDEQINYADQLDVAHRLSDKVAYLQRELVNANLAQVAWSEVPEDEQTSVPQEFAELFDQLSDLPNIVMSGDQQPALDLEDHDHLGNVAAKAWQALQALNDYATARAAGDFTQGVHPYLQKTPSPYRSYSANRHAAGESEPVRTNSRLYKARIFSVPVSVDPAGACFMEAHFKLGAQGTLSPRLYYLDATPTDGKIYIGYIGRHLANTKTN